MVRHYPDGCKKKAGYIKESKFIQIIFTWQHVPPARCIRAISDRAFEGEACLLVENWRHLGVEFQTFRRDGVIGPMMRDVIVAFLGHSIS